MRIGILTFHRAHNYGAVLQAYALQTILEKHNHEVEFIDYYNPRMLHVYKWFDLQRFRTKSIKHLVHELFLLINRKRRFMHFDKFIHEYLKLSPVPYDLASYDLIIVGSDQVWNTKLTNGFDKMYWGNFPHPSSLGIVSYAASMEENMTDKEMVSLSLMLENFKYISVREKSLAARLSSLTDKPVYLVSDPTLLLGTADWNKMTDTPIIHKKYVLLYQVRNDPKAENIAKAIAKRMGIELVYLSARIDLENSKEAIASGPIEFLSLFKHASYVVCTSFHGTVFSIIFNVPFCSVLLNDGKDSRVKDLLEYFHLESRGVGSFQETVFDNIGWEDVNRDLAGLRAKSIDYLNMISQ